MHKLRTISLQIDHLNRTKEEPNRTYRVEISWTTGLTEMGCGGTCFFTKLTNTKWGMCGTTRIADMCSIAGLPKHGVWLNVGRTLENRGVVKCRADLRESGCGNV